MICPETATREELVQALTRLEADYERLKAQYAVLVEQIILARKRTFGPSSEQSPPGQERLVFNEVEDQAAPTPPEPEAKEEPGAGKKRTRGPRRVNVDHLPVDEVVYDLPENERTCNKCGGDLHKIGEECNDKLEVIPAQWRVKRTRRAKYGCRHCQDDGAPAPVFTVPGPAQAFPNSLASPSAVAHIIHEKYVQGVPLYRQEQALERQGVELTRQTMANWVIAGADWLEAIHGRMHTLLLEQDVLHADETRVQVLHEAGRAATDQSIMWLYRTGREGPHIVLYEYQPTRKAEHPCKFLKGFRGYLHADGYSGYELLPNVTIAGCWAHARRGFVRAVETLPKELRNKGGTHSHKGLAFCDRLFGVERTLHNVSASQRYDGRLKDSKPILDEFKAWLNTMSVDAAPKTRLAAAVGYCLNQWAKLNTFLQDGRLEIDNNRAERAIKPFVIGRKNWLFANTPRGADTSAVLYSIVETAKENGIQPLPYLTHLFERLPNMRVSSNTSLDELLPWHPSIQDKLAAPSATRKP